MAFPRLGVASLLVFISVATFAGADDSTVVQLNGANFEQQVKDNPMVMVQFYAPWCGHCKKLAAEFTKAADVLRGRGVMLAKVDATEEKGLAAKYSVKGFPTVVWFEGGNQQEYDGRRTSDAIIEWVTMMSGPAVQEVSAPTGPPTSFKPHVVLHADSLLPGFLEAAKLSRRAAVWYFVRVAGGTTPRVALQHRDEPDVELFGSSCEDKDAVSKLLTDNLLPLFGPLDAVTFDHYTDQAQGLVWSMFPADEPGATSVETDNRPMMMEVARAFKGQYLVTYTDTVKFKDAIDSMMAVEKFPAIAVQKRAGDKRKYIYHGAMTASNIIQFIRDVGNNQVQPTLKSEPLPGDQSQELIKQLVGSNLQREVFDANKDVVLFVYAAWCGHCKKMEPEYMKLAKKIKKDDLEDLLMLTKIDGTQNDSPVSSMDWREFPTIYFIKQNSHEPMLYDGERTAKGLWKYVKKHATRATDIYERLERKRESQRRAEEL